MHQPLAVSVRTKLKEIFKDNNTYLKSLEHARRNLITYFDKSKLHTLFTKAIDACPFVDYYSARDRRVNKTLPTYKLKINYAFIPREIKEAASKKPSISDAKAYIIQQGVLGPYLNNLFKVLEENDMNFLKEAIPSKEIREEISDFLTAMYVMDTLDEFERPIFVKQII